MQVSSSPYRATTLLLSLLLLTLTSASPLTNTLQPTNQPPSPSPSPSAHPTPTLNPHPNPNLRRREIVVGDPALAVQPLNPTQVSPITTLMFWQTVAPGQPAQQVQVVYSQAFAPIPDQWEGPQVGSVGLGGIKGEVGVVRTGANRKRAAATVMPAALRLRDADADADADANALFILPPPPPVAVAAAAGGGLEKRKGGKSSSGSGGDAGEEEEEEEESGAVAKRAGLAGARSLGLLLVVALVVVGLL